MDPVRCPYCVYRDEFRIMIPQGIYYYVCEKCGHISAPGLPNYECRCLKCKQIKSA